MSRRISSPTPSMLSVTSAIHGRTASRVSFLAHSFRNTPFFKRCVQAESLSLSQNMVVVGTRCANGQITPVVTLWASNVIYAEMRHASGAIKIVNGGLLCPKCRQPVAATGDHHPQLFGCPACR
jgi:hypothetical protein